MRNLMMFKNNLIKLFDKILFIVYPSKMKKSSIPTSLNNAIETLFNDLKPEDIEFIKTKNHSMIHFSGGMAMRNNWKLWDRNGDINKDIQTRFGLAHGDDISNLIFSGLWAKVKNENVELALEKCAKDCKNHWLSDGIDPITGETITKFSKKKAIIIQVTKDGAIKYL